MARRAASVTKARTSPKKPATSAAAKPESARRGAKSKPQDDLPMEMPAPEPILAGADEPAHEPEAPPLAKAKRGRKPKPDAMPAAPDDTTAAAEPETPEPALPEPELPEPELPKPELPRPKAQTPKPPPRKTRRNREPEASAPPPLDLPDETPVESPAAAAAEWHAESETVTFDWPAIEQVAAAEGPNQPMAKLLLAARAEGARSRWPF